MDELKLYTYIAVFGSFGMYFAIAWWARAGSTKEFYIAGGGIGPIQNGMAIGADWMSAAASNPTSALHAQTRQIYGT